MKKSIRKIIFSYSPYKGRTMADCGDTYNWLLDLDIEIATVFQKKYLATEKELKIKLEKELKKQKTTKK